MADLIDRQAAIDAINDYFYRVSVFEQDAVAKCQWIVADLPSVNPQKVGRSEMYKILQSIRAECWDAGWNMTGEYQGAWTRYRDIEKIIDKYIAKMEVE